MPYGEHRSCWRAQAISDWIWWISIPNGASYQQSANGVEETRDIVEAKVGEDLTLDAGADHLKEIANCGFDLWYFIKGCVINHRTKSITNIE